MTPFALVASMVSRYIRDVVNHHGVGAMFSDHELSMLAEALETKLQSLRRGVNTSRQPEFKALYERQVAEYSALQSKVVLGGSGNEASSDGSRKK